MSFARFAVLVMNVRTYLPYGMHERDRCIQLLGMVGQSLPAAAIHNSPAALQIVVGTNVHVRLFIGT